MSPLKTALVVALAVPHLLLVSAGCRSRDTATGLLWIDQGELIDITSLSAAERADLMAKNRGATVRTAADGSASYLEPRGSFISQGLAYKALLTPITVTF